MALVLLVGLWVAELAACERRPPQRPDRDTAGGAGDASAPELSGPEFPDPAAPRQRPPPEPIGDLEGAFAGIAAGNYEGAIDHLRAHLEATPEDLRAGEQLAHALILVGRYEEAARLAEGFAVGTPPQLRPAAARWFARAREAQGRIGEAEARLEASLREHPDDLALRGDLLDLYSRTGRRRTQRARELRDSLYDAFDVGAATTAEALLAVAKATLSSGTGGGYHDANDVLADAERLEPAAGGSALADEIHLRHAAIFHEKYATDEAMETYAMVLARNPWQPDALAGVAELRLTNFELAAATRSALEALQVNPHHRGAHVALAQISLVEGRRAEALERLDQEVFSVDPTYPPARAVQAAAAIFAGDEATYARARDAALSRESTGATFFVRLADLLGFLHLYPESEAVLAEAEVLEPDNPYLLSARGLNLLRLAREREGRAALDRAWSRDRFNERTFNTRRLYEDRIGPHYVDRASPRHLIRLPGASAELVFPEIDDAVSRAREALDAAYGIDPGRVQFEVYETPEDFAIRTVGVPSLGALGVCFGPVITVVGPFTGRFNFRAVVWHELAHTYAITLSRGRVPRWFTEGLSEWESELADPAWARESAELLVAARRAGKLRRLGELELAFLRAESPKLMEVAYATATYAVRYLGQTYGHRKLEAILRGYADGSTTDELFSAHLGKDLATVEAEFDRWFRAELDATIKGWQPGSASRGDDPRDALLEEAIAKLGAGAHEEAIAKLRRLIEGEGDGHLPRLLLGRALLEQGKIGPARDHFQKAATFHLESTAPYEGLADAARQAGDVEAEKAAVEQILRVDAQDLAPAVRMLLLAMLTDDPPRLEKATDRALAIAPLHPATLAAWSLRALDAGDKQRARKLMSQATRVEGGPAVTFAIVALAAERHGDRELAASFAQQALAASEGRLPGLGEARMRGLLPTGAG